MKANENSYFSIFSNCIIVKGNCKTILCDLQRNNLIKLSREQLEIIDLLKSKPVNKILNSLNEKNKLYVTEFIAFLKENDLGFYTKDIGLFPKLDLSWKSPFLITNAIIDIEIIDNLMMTKAIKELIELRCPFIQIRIFNVIQFEQLDSILNLFSNSRIQSIEILLQFDSSNREFNVNIKELIDKNQRITKLIVCGAVENNQIVYKSFIIIYTTQFINNINFCGVIQTLEFSLNIENFTEAQSYNTCLNRKIAIDVDGNIKNCPSMRDSFGNIKDTTLLAAIEKPGFKKYWDINKDKIHVCKDCEFRYICTDCRAYVEDPEDILSKPLKCGYNPYTGEWSEWSTNPLKQKAIEFYGMEDLVAARARKGNTESQQD